MVGIAFEEEIEMVAELSRAQRTRVTVNLEGSGEHTTEHRILKRKRVWSSRGLLIVSLEIIGSMLQAAMQNCLLAQSQCCQKNIILGILNR